MVADGSHERIEALGTTNVLKHLVGRRVVAVAHGGFAQLRIGGRLQFLRNRGVGHQVALGNCGDITERQLPLIDLLKQRGTQVGLMRAVDRERLIAPIAPGVTRLLVAHRDTNSGLETGLFGLGRLQ